MRMRNWRTAVYAFCLAILVGTIWVGPATNEVHAATEEQAVLEDLGQSFTVSKTATLEGGERDEYSVVVVPVVQWPTTDHTVTQGLGNFGIRHCRGCSLHHEGADFNPGGGAPVEVVEDGVVLSAGWSGALGEAVRVQHSSGMVTVYGHMRAGSLRVSQGQRIKRGATLGLVGDTGASTGNHLHFEVRLGGVAVDPMVWLHAHVNNSDWNWME